MTMTPISAPRAHLGRSIAARARPSSAVLNRRQLMVSAGGYDASTGEGPRYSPEQLAFLERRAAEGYGRGDNGASRAPAATQAPVVATPPPAGGPAHWCTVAPLSYGAIDQMTPKGLRAGADRGTPEDFTRPLLKGIAGTSGCGFWACTEGAWPSSTHKPITEWFIVLSGEGCLTDVDGTEHPFGPGDCVIIPKGWHGRWAVDAKIHKFWTTTDHPEVATTGPAAAWGATKSPLTAVVASVSSMAGKTSSPAPRPTSTWGSPTTTSATMYDIGHMSAGYWTCTPGGFPVTRKESGEAFYVLEGTFFLTNADGSARRCVAGDSVVLPKGWSGHWDVLETVKKVWVDFA